ncbi:MAG TPA: glycosyltransferase [Rudaea sp.]|jgi:glycosyltransferase involved in cell wall biosynthesis
MASINLIARDIGFGLSRDLRLLAAALASRGHVVCVSAIRRGKLRKFAGPWRLRARSAARRLRGDGAIEFDVNLMLEEIRSEYLPLARRNVLLPNPEWFRPQDRQALGAIDCVFAKTRHAESIFAMLGCAVAFTGFTSDDRYDHSIARECAFFHLAGRSRNKNTEPLLQLWRRHPQWPRLTVVQDPRSAQPAAPVSNIDHRIDHLDDAELRRLQNRHRFHLCPSQTEGFGHYLVEAMSVGAVTLTLDAAPMNELVTIERGVVVPVARTATQRLATTNYFDDAEMERAVERIIGLGDAECERLGSAARAWFLDNDRAFSGRLDAAVRAL